MLSNALAIQGRLGFPSPAVVFPAETRIPAKAVLDDRLRAYVRLADGALSANTQRALASDSAIFTGWCAGQGLDALPAAPATVAAFIDDVPQASRRRPARPRSRWR